MKEFLKRHIPFVQVGMVGATGAVVQAVLLILFVEVFGFHPVLANTIAAEFAITSNFTLNNLWTFRDRLKRPLYIRFLIFNASALGSVALQAAAIAIGIRLFGETYYLLYAAAGVGVGWVSNYLMYNYVIWKRHPKTSEEPQ
jgi:dolichol-phosphate mannosyltransferase